MSEFKTYIKCKNFTILNFAGDCFHVMDGSFHPKF